MQNEGDSEGIVYSIHLVNQNKIFSGFACNVLLFVLFSSMKGFGFSSPFHMEPLLSLGGKDLSEVGERGPIGPPAWP